MSSVDSDSLASCAFGNHAHASLLTLCFALCVPSQDRRETMKNFLTGELPVIVATGVLGRGLDLLKVTQVIVFDFPSSVQEYIHMIGRASRLGNAGSAMVFVDNESKALFKELVTLLRASGTVIPRELLNSPYLHSTYALAYNKKKRRRKHVDSDSDQ